MFQAHRARRRFAGGALVVVVTAKPVLLKIALVMVTAVQRAGLVMVLQIVKIRPMAVI